MAGSGHEPVQSLRDHRDSAWIAGCEHCRREFVEACEQVGFTPRIAYTSDDVIVEQALATYGDPPDPPATTAFSTALHQAVQQTQPGEPASAGRSGG